MIMLQQARSKGSDPRLQSTVKNMNTEDGVTNQEIYKDMFQGCKSVKSRKSMAQFCDKMGNNKINNRMPEPPKPVHAVDPETVYRPKPVSVGSTPKRSFAKIGNVEIKLNDVVKRADVAPRQIPPPTQSIIPPAINSDQFRRSKFEIESCFRPLRTSPTTLVSRGAREACRLAFDSKKASFRLDEEFVFAQPTEWVAKIQKVEWCFQVKLAKNDILLGQILSVYSWVKSLVSKTYGCHLSMFKEILNEVGIQQTSERNIVDNVFMLTFVVIDDSSGVLQKLPVFNVKVQLV